MSKVESPIAASKLLSARFVDDIETGNDNESVVNEMRGQVAPYTFETSGSLARIMGIGTLKLKVIVKNGDPPGEMVIKLGGAALGIPWNLTEDKMWIILSVNLSARKKSSQALEDVIVDRLEEIDQIVI